MENSKIEWTDHTFNPWIGCTKVSPACENCYAERDMDLRFGKAKWGPKGSRVMTSQAYWRKPIQWNREAMQAGRRYKVFCASLADVFESWDGPITSSCGKHLVHGVNGFITGDNEQAESCSRVTMGDVRRKLFELIDETPWLDWLLLTKRPENVVLHWPGHARHNVLLGATVESQKMAFQRLPYLLSARGLFVERVFVSAEPLLGPLVLQGDTSHGFVSYLSRIDWVITGGESGPGARASDPDWFRSLRDQCGLSGVPFFFKQWGEFANRQLRVGKVVTLLDGVAHNASY